MSWGRHGWPRKNESMRLYKEKDGAYLLINLDNESATGYDAVGNNFTGPNPSLGSCTINRSFTYDRGCKRVQWSELPEVWQKAFSEWFDQNPKEVKGFWLVSNKERI